METMTIKMGESLFKNNAGTSKYEVKSASAADELVVGKIARAKKGVSSKRPATAKNGAKVNGIMQTIDNILVNKTANAIASDETVYTEFTSDGVKYSAIFNGTDMSFANEELPKDFTILTPVVMYALAGLADADEFVKRFEDAVEEYNTDGVLSSETVFGLCDSFYYEVVADNLTEVTAFPDDLSLEVIKQGYTSELFTEVETIEELELEDLDALEGVARHAKKSSKSSASKKVDSAVESYMNGEHELPFEWNEDQKDHIPSKDVLKNTILIPQFFSVSRKIEYRGNRIIDRINAAKTAGEEIVNSAAIGGDAVNVLLIGKPSTGKTTIAHAIASALNIPIYISATTKNTEEDEYEGKTKIVSGKPDFVSTEFLDCFEHGGVIVLEEINLADPGVVMGALGQAIEAPYVLKKDGYKTIKRHPLCFIIGTMNVGTYGSRPLSQALASRFKQVYTLNDPSESDFLKILESKGYDSKRCKWVYDMYVKICDHLKDPDVHEEDLLLNVTLRGCIGALQNMEEGDSPKEAINNSLVGQVAMENLELAEDIKNIIAAQKDPSF